VLFAAGLLILVDQSADLIAILLSRPTDIASPNWRFGLFGMVTSRTSALLVGDVMLFAAATALGWRSMLRALGVLHFGLGAAGLAGLVLFGLDAVQVRGSVPTQSAAAFSAAALRAGLVALIGAVTLGWAGLAAWQSSHARPRGGREAPEAVLVGRPTKRPRG